MQTASPLDQREFRRALGLFATGVTIVTVLDHAGMPVGVTANSFNSVSMDPPMVLWSLAKTAHSLPAFSQAQDWNVHILASHQKALSARFACAGTDKFAGLALDLGVGSAPLLGGCTARFQCRTKFLYEGGDHVILVGEVCAHDVTSHPPLLYVSGGYALATPWAGEVATSAEAVGQPSLFTENLLGFLLGRAHFLYLDGFRHSLIRHGLRDADFYVLSLLALQPSLPLVDIVSHLAFTGIDTRPALMRSLRARGLIETDAHPARYRLSGDGERVVLHTLAACKAVEEDLIGRIGEQETSSLRNLLKRVILASDPGLPKVWSVDASKRNESRSV